MLSRLWSPLELPPTRRRGGWRQRAEAEAAAARDVVAAPISMLAARQLLVWSDGSLSASKLQTIMSDAVSDGLTHPMVQRLSDIKGGQHANTSLLQLLKEKTAVLDDIREVDHLGNHLLPPSAIIRRLYAHNPSEFTRILGAERGRVRSFWEQFWTTKNDKYLSEHPLLRGLALDDLACIVPLVLHQDAAPITKLLGANMISVSSILGLGSEKTTQLLIATHIKRNKAEAPNLSHLWQAILDDFEVLFHKDEASRGPWRFVLLFALGDEECRCVEWGLTSWSAAEECCSECKAH